MGGNGSGRKSVKGQAIYCLLGTQLKIQEFIHEKIDDPRVTREELKQEATGLVKEIKVAQEEIERL